DYRDLLVYDIVSKEIKKKVLYYDNGFTTIRRYKNSTYIDGYYGSYFVNHDNLATDTWEEKTIPFLTTEYIYEMNFITDDFFVFTLGRDQGKGGMAITYDGGNSWKIDTEGFDEVITDVEYLGNDHLVATVYKG